MENSGIGWTDHTANFWWGCNKVSDECKFCYIAPLMRRAGVEPFQGPIRCKSTWRAPARWNQRAKKEGRRLKIFTCSMSDFFHPGADQWRNAAWRVIRRCKYLDWLILTKRPELMQDRLPADWGKGYPNVWLGVSCGVRKSLPRVELLCDTPSRRRFISAEPLMQQIDFTPYLDGRIHWIITGCERAHKNKRRAMNIDWVRDIDQQCRAANVRHFFKQRYENDKLLVDGLLDGEKRQAWPGAVPAAYLATRAEM